MPRPYIDTYQNEDGDLVLVYIAEVKAMEPANPEHIVIKSDHINEVITLLDEFLGD